MILAMVTDKFMAKTTYELKQLTSTELQNVTSKVNSKIGLLFFLLFSIPPYYDALPRFPLISCQLV